VSQTPPKGPNAYSRFIPREELGDFAAWKPGTFSDGSASADTPAPTAPAEPTVDEWRAKVAAARQAGYQDGYRDGLVALEGFKQSFATQATAQVGHLIRSFDTQFQDLDQRIAEAVARTAVQLARQVLRSAIAANPALVSQVAGEAVGAVLLSARHITVRVNPLDLPLVAEGADEALKARGARLVADPAIERGGALVESDLGSIDARVASRWIQAANALGTDTEWGSA
jgi:flagellar assembly protein FliH